MKKYKHLPVFEGHVEEHSAAILRDTGCSCAIVKKPLEEPSEFTGEGCLMG